MWAVYFLRVCIQEKSFLLPEHMTNNLAVYKIFQWQHFPSKKLILHFLPQGLNNGGIIFMSWFFFYFDHLKNTSSQRLSCHWGKSEVIISLHNSSRAFASLPILPCCPCLREKPSPYRTWFTICLVVHTRQKAWWHWGPLMSGAVLHAVNSLLGLNQQCQEQIPWFYRWRLKHSCMFEKEKRNSSAVSFIGYPSPSYTTCLLASFIHLLM